MRVDSRFDLDNELKLIGGIFTHEIPPDKQYLYKYFSNECGKAFVRYYYHMNSYGRFKQHAGFNVTNRNVFHLLNKYRKLELILKEAQKNFDFDLVAKIKSGQYEL